MPSYRAKPSRPEKAKAIVAVVAVHAAMGALLLIQPPAMQTAAESRPPVMIDIDQPPPPPPPEPEAGKAPEEEGAAGKKDEPTPVVAPQPKIVLPAKPPIPAAPVAGTGSSPNAGTATAGTGTGAGGSGTGRGGGGAGGGGGIGSEARLLGGHRSRLPSDLLRQFSVDRGFAHLWLTVADSGRVTDCSVFQGSGNAEVDQALCGLMVRQSRWSPARDLQGHPITVRVRYTATWRKD
ncbi:MAG TPA: energy transducer TonB [Sphingomicrobium sp.]|nr:energy transducer TonB [Sphingomicrobium sp.]